MVDAFSSEYGWTLNEILDLTMLQASTLLEQIGIRKHNEYAAQAGLHGHKIKMKEKFQYAQKLSGKEAEDADAAVAKVIEKIKAG